MEIYGLYGKSGTGKSHKSSQVIDLYQIDAIIDDGILIMNKMRVAGKSAKNEKSLYKATKTAIFSSDSHRQEIYDFIQKTDIPRLLVIGTSQKMVRKIAERLDLPGEIKWLFIESFQTEEEIHIAHERRAEGFHVIPIIPIEVEKTYSGWFRNLVIHFDRRKEEVTLVRPLYFGDRITIDPQCVIDLVTLTTDPLLKIQSVKVNKKHISIKLSMQQEGNIENLLQWKKKLSDFLSYSLGIEFNVDVEWCTIIQSKQVKKSTKVKS
jgi:hypothetical protein